MKNGLFRFFLAVGISVLAVLLTGCGGASPPVSVQGGEGSVPGGDAVQVPQNPGQLTPDGQVIDPGIGAGNPGGANPGTAIPGDLPGDLNGQQPAVPMDVTSVDWLDYKNEPFSFTLKYPNTYVIMPKSEPGKMLVTPLEVVMLQDKDIASSDVGDMAPPAFSVRVFDNPEKQNAAQWLVKNQFINQEAVKDLKNIVVDNVGGVQNCTAMDIAPNCLIYIPFKGNLYEITLNGEYAQAILENFRFLK